MANAVLMPKAGITVESCIIGQWEKKVGDQVSVGDILFTYETDKASFECESTEEGELLEIFYENGDEVVCLTNVCAIGKKGEDVSALRPQSSAPAAPAAPAATAVATPAASTAEKPVPTSGQSQGKISPRARKLAARSGVDASLAVGTGPQGRIIERDIRSLMTSAPSVATASAGAAASAAMPDAEFEDIKFAGIRKLIADSMMKSIHNSAQLTHSFSFDATAINQYRQMAKASEGDMSGITVGDMIAYAVSRTLKDFPDMNAHMIEQDTLRRYKDVNLGIAVDTPRGLIVPVVMQADKKSLLEISKEIKELAAEAVSGHISPDKLVGGTFTVSNLGVFGVEHFTPIINPPQVGILGVCKIIERPRTGKDGQIELYPAMGLSLTYDHRAIDGAPASKFVQAICKNLEQFQLLLAR